MTTNQKKTSSNKYNYLPRVLKKEYTNVPFVLQLKTTFLFYLNISLIIASIFFFLFELYIFKSEHINATFYKYILLSEITLILVLILSLFLLIKGKQYLSAHIIFISALISVWYSLLVDQSPPIERIDTTVIIIAILTILPLTISDKLYLIPFYLILNFIGFAVFSLFVANDIFTNITSQIEFLGDIFIALVVIAIVAYNVIRINHLSLQKAESDIAERKMAEESLSKSEKKYREMMEMLPQVVFETDLSGNLKYINKHGFVLFEYSDSDFKNGIDVYKIIDQKDHKRMAENMQKLPHTKTNAGNIYSAVKKNGHVFPVQVYASIITENSTPVGIRGIIIDVEDQQKANRKLKESEEKYRILLENMNEVVMYVDNDDRVKFVNKKFTETLGYTPEEIIGKIGYSVLLDSKDQNTIRKANSERLKNQSGQYELTFIGKSGQKVDFLINGTPLKDELGNTIGSIGTMTDISHKKKAEKELKESEERYRKLFEAFPDIIMVSDLSGKIIYGNKALEEITGITTKEFENTNRKAKIHPDDFEKVAIITRDLLKSEKNHSDLIENRFIDMWGKEHWFAGKIAKLNLNGEIFLQTITRDITQNKKIEAKLKEYQNNLELLVKNRTEELEAANEELIATNDELYNQREELQSALQKLHQAKAKLVESEKMVSLGVLTSGVAHEINNPLNYIQGGIFVINEFINENLPEPSDDIKEMINALQIGVDRISKIVNSLNHFSRQNESLFEKCNINTIIENCLTMLENDLKYKITINYEPYKKPLVVLGNEGKLHQVFLNVLSNAQQAITDKGEINIETKTQSNYASITIVDNGSGVDKANIAQVFNPFFTTKDPGKGTGLGLSITYSIIQEHNGNITFDSELNKGTKVIIELPLMKS